MSELDLLGLPPGPLESGIHLVHKPVGPTSFQLVRAAVRHAAQAGQPKWAVGHGGTLDPFAEGLLLLLSGQATRFMELLHGIPKGYVAEVRWGRETDTGDHLGKEVAGGAPLTLTPEALDALLPRFLGWSEQIPPATSAKKVDGEAAYKKAHRGEEVEMKPSRVFLLDAAWVSHELPHRSLLRITCRGGFYVRSLARDLGRAAGSGAHLGRLHRTSIGPWSDPGPGQSLCIRGEGLLPWLPSRALDEREAKKLGLGQPIGLGDSVPPTWPLPATFPAPEVMPLRGFHEGRLLALLQPKDDGKLWTFANLRGGL